MPSRTAERPALFGLVDLGVLGEAMAVVTAADPSAEESRRALSLASMPSRALASLASSEEAGNRYDAAASLAERSDAPRVARLLLASEKGAERALGVALLGQITSDDDDGVRAILSRALSDPSQTVRAEAALAAAHRADRKLMREVITLASSLSAEVRLGVAGALAAHVVIDAELAVPVLVGLSRDPDVWVRSWATFGLARADVGSDEVRDALILRAMTDDDPEVRGEALEGLADLRDARTCELVEAELERGSSGEWPYHAALANPARALVPALRASRARLIEEGDDELAGLAAQAIAACVAAAEPIEA